MFYTCLFATHGTDLRAPLRAGASDDELAAIVRSVWTRAQRSLQRAAHRAAAREVSRCGKIEMNYIGG